MDQVLCIDLSIEPARVALVSVENRTLNIIESRQFSIQDEIKLADLLNISLVEGRKNTGSEDTIQPDESAATPEEVLQSSKEQQVRPLSALVAALNDLPKTWTNSVLIIPMNEYLSLNVTLPFSDQKNLGKILDLEVQDVIPFEIDEFIVEGHSISELSPNQFDVHVSLAPKRFIGNILTLIRASGIEPSIITTPCSSLATLPYLAPEYFRDTFALISVTAQGVYLCASIDGLVRSDKVIPAPAMAAPDTQWFFPELKLSLMSLEKRYGKTFSNVYVNAPKKTIADLQQTLGRSIETLEPADFIGSQFKEVATSAFCALFAGGEHPLTPLTNFRVREYSFRPNWGALFRALATIKFYFLGLLVLVLGVIFLTYEVREIEISRLRSAMREQVLAVVPNLKSAEGGEILAFNGELQTLARELQSIGSSKEISPTNILIELTKELADQKDATFSEIDIRADRVLLEISVPDYTAAQRIEDILEKRRDLFHRVKKETSGYPSSSGGRNFNFELWFFDETKGQ